LCKSVLFLFIFGFVLCSLLPNYIIQNLGKNVSRPLHLLLKLPSLPRHHLIDVFHVHEHLAAILVQPIQVISVLFESGLTRRNLVSHIEFDSFRGIPKLLHAMLYICQHFVQGWPVLIGILYLAIVKFFVHFVYK